MPRSTVSCVTYEGRYSGSGSRLAEPQPRPLFCLLGLDGAIARRCMRVQRRQKPPCGLTDLLDRTVERRLIGLRRLVEAGEFSHELQRGGVDLVLGRGRLEIEQCLDV